MKYLLIFLSLILILSFMTVAYAEAKLYYDFDEALKMALENSYEYKSKDKAISKAYDAFEAAEKEAPKEISYTGSMKKFVSDQIEPTIKADKAYHSYRQSILDRVNMKANIAISLRSLIIEVSSAKKSVEEAATDTKAWNEEIKLLDLRFDKSLIPTKEYKEKKKELENKIKTAAKTSNTLKDANYKLNDLLGKREGDIEIALNDTIFPLDELDLIQIKNDLIKNDMTLLQKKNQRSLALTNYSLVEERYDKYNWDRLSDTMLDELIEIYEEAKEDYEEADKEYRKALENFDKNFDKITEGIKEGLEDFENLKQEIMEEEQNLRNSKLKYDFKIISKKEYEDIQKNIDKLRNKLISAEMSINLDYAKLLIYSNLEKVILINQGE
ncbi:MAG: hypothetical protein M0P77_07275 [Firmicutes bacterium]|nr:hypothetical protein [Bacillota bacterium]